MFLLVQQFVAFIVRWFLMCGIGGFSLSNGSKVSPRRLANALLTEMDVRGNQASGFAFQSRTSSGVFKKDVAGARLNLKGLSRGAVSVILHTRYATHGTITNMANNHPVQSPDKNIALVHNGVIYNHDLVRESLNFKLPEVDTAVIPAILQQFDNDTNKFSMLDGDASVAWLDENDLGVLRVARISHSPLFIAQLKDGSFVFGSTEGIVLSALKRAGLKAVFCETVPERTLLTVRGGRLDSVEALPETDVAFVEKAWYSAGSYRNMTSGGHGKAVEGTVVGAPTVYQSAFGEVVVPASWQLAGDEGFSSDFPQVPGLTVNGFGEYYDKSGSFVGDVQDLFEWGYIEHDGEVHSYDDGVGYQLTNNFRGGLYGMWD